MCLSKLYTNCILIDYELFSPEWFLAEFVLNVTSVEYTCTRSAHISRIRSFVRAGVSSQRVGC